MRRQCDAAFSCLCHIGLFDSYRDLGLVAEVGGDRRDLVDNLDALGNSAECRILAVEVGCILVHDEELAGGRVGIKCSRHGDNSALVLDRVVVTVCTELADDVLLRAAHTVTEGIAALDHKAGDNSVEGETVVEALLNEIFEVFYGLGGVLGIELKLDLAAVFHFDDYHIFFLSCFKKSYIGI